MIRFLISLTLFALAIMAQAWVAGDPVMHVLVQMPLLAAAGYLLPHRLTLPRAAIGPVLILALVTCVVWMLPRSVDAALSEMSWHLAKFVTLPLGFGLALSLTWPAIGPVLRGFIKAQVISMLLLLGFLYTHAPIRICNSYLVDDQDRLGLGFVTVALGLTLWWIIPAFLGKPITLLKDKPHDVPRLGHKFF
ncbi:hypothetical protein [uncultured Roseobacter sp.]|uniref:hypothetical protein n=1 Tax=uncultured Roseobacter sp. TaxID=114847 RepID=UPI00262EC910|nr:hypothetical protein [uncultured Roseobacter sp.]